MKDFNLSKKRKEIRPPYDSGNKRYFYDEKDVKEFIKELKELISEPDFDKRLDIKEIDKIAGEDLVK